MILLFIIIYLKENDTLQPLQQLGFSDCGQAAICSPMAENFASSSHNSYNSQAYSFKSWILPVTLLEPWISISIQAEVHDSTRPTPGGRGIRRFEVSHFPLAVAMSSSKHGKDRKGWCTQ